MRLWKVIVGSGLVILVLGAIFHLQGQSIVGPETSFMYANPEWVSYGIQIVITGLIIVGAGIFIKFKKSI